MASKAAIRGSLISVDNRFIAGLQAALDLGPINISLDVQGELDTPASSVAFIIIDLQQIKDFQILKRLNSVSTQVILVSHLPINELFLEVIKHFEFYHLVGKNGHHVYQEILETIRWITVPGIQSFALRRFLNPDGLITTCQLRRSSEINDIIQTMSASFEPKVFFSGYGDAVRSICNELLTNAMYNAPCLAGGEPKYESLDRRQKVHLTKKEGVQFAIGMDTEKTVIMVRDNFGRLSKSKIFERFVLGYSNKNFIEKRSGGAGAGIYMSFINANRFLVRVKKKKFTQVFCFIEHTNRYLKYRTRIQSFNYLEIGMDHGAHR